MNMLANVHLEFTQIFQFLSLHSLPSNVENVLRKYVVLSPIRINEEGYTRTRTEDMMFVPKSQVHNRCNGILLFENFEKFNNDKDFCNKPFGKLYYYYTQLIKF